VSCFTLLEVAGDRAVTGDVALDPAWGAVFGTTLVLYVIVLVLKTRTRVLTV
jgi:hypothetical protein